ncbi:hypothetical protein FS749_016184 [Ceratobasidium sp. UAMH 11750]|nr:hypothetical protein FS749_016184 [Ceratobasidium sp. UAMH 11750]
MLYSIATMFRRRGWFGALCFVLAATLPTYVLGSQVLLSLSSLPAVEALSILSPHATHHSPPPIFSFPPIRIADLTRKLTVWPNNTGQVLSHLFNRPRSVFSRLASRVHRVISIPLPRPSLPPPATRTIGGSPPPTRTRTTTTHRPAPPEPAYARLSGRSCTFHRPSESSESSDPRLRHRGTTAFAQGMARCLRILSSSVSWLRRALVDAALLFTWLAVEFWSPDPTTRLENCFSACCIIFLFTWKVRKVDYRYDIIFEGDQFPSKRILDWKQSWIAWCPYFRRERMDWEMWEAIDRDIQTIRRNYGRVRGFSLKVRVIRERMVRDWNITIFGMRSVEVVENPYHGTDVFETEDNFLLSAPDLDRDLQLPTRGWGEIGRDWLLGEPPTPPSSAPPTPSPPQRAFVRPVRIADPDDPSDAGEDERMLWH